MRIVLLLLAAVAGLAQDGYYRFAVDQDHLAGAPDFSFLNHPIGAEDRIFPRDGHFYTVGRDLKPNTRDDRRERFFGVNLAFGANFPEPQDASRIAKRLRRLGVNIVRLHHMDTNPDRDPANAGSSLTTEPYPTLNEIAVKRLRGFLDALKAEGIYANLNLHVGYRFRPEIDKVPPEEIPIHSKPLHIFYPRMVALQAEYARKLIAALALRGDPVLAMVEINNESALVDSWMRGNLEKTVSGAYRDELERKWKQFPGGGGPMQGDAFLRFLMTADRAYLDTIRDAVRESTDKLVPVAGTQMGFGGLLNLDSHAGLDYQDNHFYVDHYNFPHQRWDPRDWRIRDMSSVGSGLSAFLNMAAAREAGRPYTVSEFNQPWPNRQAAEIDPTLAAFGAFQGWDGIMHFAYSHNRNWDNGTPSGFDLNSDWSKWPGFGQSALLFRSVVREGKSPLVYPVSTEQRLAYTRAKRTGGLAAFFNLDPAVALAHPVAIRRDDKGTALSVAAGEPGEISYDGAVFRIAAPQAAGVFGFVKKAAAGAIEVELAPSARGFVTLLVTALDGMPIADSRRMLLSIPGATFASLANGRMQKLVPYSADWYTLEPDQPGKPSGSRNGGVAPVWMERVESHVTLRSAARALEVWPLDGAGKRLAPVPAERTAAGFRIHLQAEGQQFAPWYEIAAR
ncbi:MAG: hypothetical protein ACE15B_02105 [Bryobacteraceae bacterium]